MRGNVIAQLHQIAAVFNSDQRRDGVLAAKRMIVGKKVRGQHSGLVVDDDQRRK